ncbi:TetR family transcriptional regulator C-terminal domain-containing protein [Streptomyces sp. NBC_00006]|uniref:TetR/AcrR family transcriptional regulator n=1 Tax=Streptomyces sp. NBC_00006 TaxID=2975619 RepID=UPI0022500670|nr:TetR family transcriptional regulator C-terminal domain-containing protein [Streptomyces sp. NBC_00006]MCX5529084.1 TetR family transcriptional regulator C-terminal domain-containing protein [Streptomyces sp. NBC_00006]
MTSRGPGKQVRKSAGERRDEIVTAAALVGLQEGLECITRQRIADDLGVRPGLIHHYFPVVEELVAEAFTSATTAELDGLLPGVTDAPDSRGALHTLQHFFALTSGAEFDDISKLWLNARHLSRYRPTLHAQVVSQELRWCHRVEQIITEGVAEGTFRCRDSWAAAVRILAVVDGVSAYINTSADQRLAPLTDLARTITEAELGLAPGALRSR